MILTKNPAEVKTNAHFGFYISLITAIATFVTFAIAIMTPPLSGPLCQGNCYEYPYTDIASRFPRDYYWMYGAMFVSLFFLAMMAVVHRFASSEKKIYSQIGLSFAIFSAIVLISNYFVQVSVIQPSLLLGETDGISILSQFNPHGVFIALEEAGFLMIVISFFCLIPVFSGKRGAARALRIVFLSAFLLAIFSFAFISMKYGIMREYRFEVAIISIAWLEIIISSILLSRLFWSGYFERDHEGD